MEVYCIQQSVWLILNTILNVWHAIAHPISFILLIVEFRLESSSGGVFFLFAYSAWQNKHITKARGVGIIFLAIKGFVLTFIGGWTQIKGSWCVCITGASPTCEFGGVSHI